MRKKRPLLFKSEMVIATLKELKKQTRRLKGLDEINEAPDRWNAFETKIIDGYFSLYPESIPDDCPWDDGIYIGDVDYEIIEE